MRLREIERIKGIGSMVVLMNHLAFLRYFVPEMGKFGWGAVDLFFVISGFSLTLSWLETERRLNEKYRISRHLKAFFTRRVFRVLPVAILVLSIAYLVSLWGRAQGIFGPGSVLRSEIFSILTLRFNYSSFPKRTILGPFWSLMVEEHFYFLLGMFFLCVRPLHWRRFLVVAIMAVTVLGRPRWIHSMGVEPYDVRILTHFRWDTLFSGVLLALWSPPKISGRRPWLIFVGHALFLFLCVFPWINEVQWKNPEWTGFVGVWASGVGLMYLASLDQNILFPTRRLAKFSEWIGERCYPIYLLHLPFAFLLHALAMQAHFVPIPCVSALKDGYAPVWANLLVGGIFFCLFLPLADFCHRFLERPLLQYGHRLGSRFLAPPSEVSPTKMDLKSATLRESA